MDTAASGPVVTYDQLPTLERLWMPVWVFDSTRAAMVWANRAALDLWDAASLEELCARDFSDMSEATRTRLASLLERLAAGGRPVDQWTFYPRGNPVTARVRRSAIRLPDGRAAMLHEALALEQSADPAVLRGVEAVHHTNVMISLFTRDGVAVMRNPSAVRAYGEMGREMDGEAGGGAPLWALFADPALADRLRRELAAGRTFSVEARMRTRDGLRWHGLDARVVTDPSTGGAAILVNEQQIEARKQAEQRLASETALLRTLIDSVPDLIVFKDADGVYLGCNTAFQRAVGRDEAEIVGRRDADLLPAEVAAAVMADDREVLDSGKSRIIEDTVRLPDGGQLLLEAIKTPLRSPDGAMIGLVAVARDVADRRRAALALAEKEAALRAILDNFPFLIWLKDTEGRFLAVNAAFAEACGRGDPAGVVGLTDADVWPPALAAAYAADDRAVLAARRRRTVEEAVERGGGRCWMETYKTPVIDADGHLLGTAGFSRDVTERREAQEALARTSADLARSNAELEQFAYVVSHDLRQPLRSVASFLTLLERHLGGSLDEDAREFLGFARSGAQRMDRLIVDLLEYSRIGRKTRPDTAVALAEIVAEALLNLEAAAAEAAAAVSVADGLPVIRGDRVELVRLFQNLIGNALKYRADDRPAVVRVGARPEGDGWRVTVADDGIGIAPEDHERIFGIFQRLHGRDRYEGTGIGLAVCRKIAEHHGGRIVVESEAGRGSAFHVILPPGRVVR